MKNLTSSESAFIDQRRLKDTGRNLNMHTFREGIQAQDKVITLLRNLRIYNTNLGKIRIGCNDDNGYVVPNDLQDIRGVLSIGTGNEIGFTEYFAQKGVPVHLYDNKIINSPSISDSVRFFPTGPGSQKAGKLMTVEKMIQSIGVDSNELLLNIDIDGADWDILSMADTSLFSKFRIIICKLHGLPGLKDDHFFNKASKVIARLTQSHSAVNMQYNNHKDLHTAPGVALSSLMEFALLRNDRAEFIPCTDSTSGNLSFPKEIGNPDMMLAPFFLNSTNIALCKPTTQSSIYNENDYNKFGACNGMKNGGCGFHTQKDTRPWWQIDLLADYHIEKIVLYNRMNFESRAAFLNVLISKDLSNWEVLHSNSGVCLFGGIDGNFLTVGGRQHIARYIKLQLSNEEYFHLDEVEVYGSKATRTNTIGMDPLPQKTEPDAGTSMPPKSIPDEMCKHFTIGGRISVINTYFDNSKPSPLRITDGDHAAVIKKLQDGTFQYYGETLSYILGALEKYPVKDKEVVIFGLAGVNCDAISIWKGASLVYAVDYNTISSTCKKLKVFTYDDPEADKIKADFGFSISSFEHDGLGRYGDKLNPWGDFEAMNNAKKYIKKDGYLFLAVPVGKDCVVWNAHRIYGSLRLPLLLAGWELVDSFGFHEDSMHSTLGTFGYQPVFVLKNTDPE